MPKFRKRPVVIEAIRLTAPHTVRTLEGAMRGRVGDYLVTGVRGEQYPVKAEIFEATYEPVEE